MSHLPPSAMQPGSRPAHRLTLNSRRLPPLLCLTRQRLASHSLRGRLLQARAADRGPGSHASGNPRFPGCILPHWCGVGHIAELHPPWLTAPQPAPRTEVEGKWSCFSWSRRALAAAPRPQHLRAAGAAACAAARCLAGRGGPRCAAFRARRAAVTRTTLPARRWAAAAAAAAPARQACGQAQRRRARLRQPPRTMTCGTSNPRGRGCRGCWRAWGMERMR